MSDDTNHAIATAKDSLIKYPERDARIGMRIGMTDAVHLCDRIASEIKASRRKSRARDAEVSAVRRCADAILKCDRWWECHDTQNPAQNDRSSRMDNPKS